MRDIVAVELVCVQYVKKKKAQNESGIYKQ